jgi:hypothetical protein
LTFGEPSRKVMKSGFLPPATEEEPMYSRDVPKEEEATLREIIRSIDKKLDFSLGDGDQAEGPNFTLRLNRESRHASVLLSIEELRGAKETLAMRSRVRQKIKRQRDHMDDAHFIKDVLGIKAARMLRQSVKPEEGFYHRGHGRSPRR